jgi:Tol biopolymer transport system component
MPPLLRRWFAPFLVLAWALLSASPAQSVEPVYDDRFPALSPDGDWIAFSSNRDGPYHIWVVRTDGTGLRRVTSGRGNDNWPAWFADGSRLVFESSRERNLELFSVAVDGTDLRRLTDHPGSDSHPAVSPVNSRIAFDSNRAPDGLAKIHLLQADGTGLELFTRNAHSNSQSAWSNDGRRIAYRQRKSTFSPASEIVIADVATGAERVVIANNAANQMPAWSPDDRRLAFVATVRGQGELFVIGVDGRDLRQLTDHPAQDLRPQWLPDGRRLLFCSDREGRFQLYWLFLEEDVVVPFEFAE